MVRRRITGKRPADAMAQLRRLVDDDNAPPPAKAAKVSATARAKEEAVMAKIEAKMIEIQGTVAALVDVVDDLACKVVPPRPPLPREEFLAAWSGSARRLVVVDLECLVPAGQTVAAELRQCLRTISSSTRVVITTDRSRHVLESALGDLPVILAPEGCSVYKRPGEGRWVRLAEEADCGEWMGDVQAIFDYYQECTPGSSTEKQEFQMRWHWQSEHFTKMAREVRRHLFTGPHRTIAPHLTVVIGEHDRSLTVRPKSCSRSACLEQLLSREVDMQAVDFAMCFAVVSPNDQDVFESLRNLLPVAAAQYTLSLGKTWTTNQRTKAQYILPRPDDVRHFIHAMADRQPSTARRGRPRRCQLR